jgi:hypothetical protein
MWGSRAGGSHSSLMRWWVSSMKAAWGEDYF